MATVHPFLLSKVLSLYTSDNTITVHLIKNDYTLGDDTWPQDGAEEADYAGYEEQGLTSWVSPVDNGDGRWWTRPDDTTWVGTDTDTQDIYGYVAVDSEGSIVWDDKIAGGPIALGTSDEELVQTITLYSGPAA